MQLPLLRALRSAPVVVVTGARQTGKSTLVQAVGGARRTYLTLDDHSILEQARTDPDSLLLDPRPVTLDEVQRAPDLLSAIKRAVDRDRTPGRFLLTGSANLLLMRQVSESLAGRAVYLTLWPMARAELQGHGRVGCWSTLFERRPTDWIGSLRDRGSRGDWRATTRRGGYPVPAARLRTGEERSLWLAGYARTYLERDLQEIASVSSLVDYRRLMQACSHRVGQILNQTELGRDAGIPQPTVHRWLNLLEASYQLVRLPAFAQNRTKRLIKSPKAFWADVGLALHLAGNPQPDGHHLENLICQELMAWAALEPSQPPAVMYWRTAAGEEVDFVVEWRNRLLPIEVKTTTRPGRSDCQGLLAFRAEYDDRCSAGLLLHGGTETRWLADGVLAVPWWQAL